MGESQSVARPPLLSLAMRINGLGPECILVLAWPVKPFKVIQFYLIVVVLLYCGELDNNQKPGPYTTRQY